MTTNLQSRKKNFRRLINSLCPQLHSKQGQSWVLKLTSFPLASTLVLCYGLQVVPGIYVLMSIVFMGLPYFAVRLFLFSRQDWNAVLGWPQTQHPLVMAQSAGLIDRCRHTKLSQDSCPNSDNNRVFRMTNVHKTKGTESRALQSPRVLPCQHLPFRQGNIPHQTGSFLPFCLCTFYFQYWSKTHITYPKPFQNVQLIGIQGVHPAAKPPSSLSVVQLEALLSHFGRYLSTRPDSFLVPTWVSISSPHSHKHS